VSWDAWLEADVGGNAVEVGWFNHTHNCNRMVARVLEVAGQKPDDRWLVGPAWWDQLAGLSGTDGAAFLDLVIGGLLEAPELFREMNPPNGWGSYDSLLGVLVEMRDAGRRYPSATWKCCG
jgi:hypothetical protein